MNNFIKQISSESLSATYCAVSLVLDNILHQSGFYSVLKD